jgi:hypothetical protein
MQIRTRTSLSRESSRSLPGGSVEIVHSCG